MKVGVIGLGQMGRGIARNLDAAGLLCAANDLNEAAFAAAELSTAVMNIAAQAMLEHVEVILFVVPGTANVAQALEGCTALNGQVVVDMTTSDPNQSRALALDLATRGFRYVDAAMTGGAAGADVGNLTLMVGADADDLKNLASVFSAIAGKVFHLGPVGAGHTVKLVHNMILHSSFLATCEGLTLAKNAGLDLNAVVEVLNAGNARSFVTDTRFPRDILSGTMNARSTISNLQKDLGLACQLADHLEGQAPYAELTSRLLGTAVEKGDDGLDFSWLFPKFEEFVLRVRSENEE